MLLKLNFLASVGAKSWFGKSETWVTGPTSEVSVNQTQEGSRMAAPHVGQGTEDTCVGESSLFFIRLRMRLPLPVE